MPPLEKMLGEENARLRIALLKIKSRADARKDVDRDLGAIWVAADDALRVRSG